MAGIGSPALTGAGGGASGGLTDDELRATPVPVSGTVTAELSAVDNAVLDAIKVDTEAIETATEAIQSSLETAGGQLVNLGANNDITLATLPDTASSDLAAQTTDLAAIEVLLGTIDADTGNLAGILTALQLLDNAISGNEMQVDVVAALPAGANLVGDVGLSGARTSGGTTPYKNLDVDESEDEVKPTAGQVYWIHAINTTAAPLYLKFYNATAANVTVGTTTPVLTLPVPANADSDGAGFTLSIPNGIAFSTAITIAATTAVADNDTGAPGANALIVNLGYA